MIQPNDVDKVENEDWEAFKKRAMQDELYYNGPGDLLDTAEGRAKFCRLNKTSIFRKPDPEFPGYKIWVFNNQGQGLVVKSKSAAKWTPASWRTSSMTPRAKRSANPSSPPEKNTYKYKKEMYVAVHLFFAGGIGKE